MAIYDNHKNEGVKSSYGYLSGYQPRPISQQVQTLKSLFPEFEGTTYDENLVERELPPGAEGWFAIPRWEKVAPTYAEAVKRVLDAIKHDRQERFYNYRSQVDDRCLRQSTKSAGAFKKFGDWQKCHDILIVPCQFGIRHRGLSACRACRVMLDNEFGLGVFDVGMMLLTHPERFQNLNDLWINCSGDEYEDGGKFLHIPLFLFVGAQIGFGAGHIDDISDRYGTPSGFYP